MRRMRAKLCKQVLFDVGDVMSADWQGGSSGQSLGEWLPEAVPLCRSELSRKVGYGGVRLEATKHVNV